MSVLQELQELIRDKYGLDAQALDPHACLRDSGIDSLALVEFIFVLEDRYGISLPDEYSKVDTLAELATLVEKVRLSKAA